MPPRVSLQPTFKAFNGILYTPSPPVGSLVDELAVQVPYRFEVRLPSLR
jgi:hypothetical protein